jgi:hypothetical protein
MRPLECSLLIDEGMGAISKLETVTALRQRLAPLRDPRSALAVVDAVVRDVVPFFGDRAEDTAFVLEGPWRSVADTITGTRVVERPGGGYEVTTFVVPGCGCRHDFLEARFAVGPIARPGETAEDAHGAVHDAARQPCDLQHLHRLEENAVGRLPAARLLPVEPVVHDRRVAVGAPLRQDDPEEAGNGGEIGLEADGHLHEVAAPFRTYLVPERPHHHPGATVGHGRDDQRLGEAAHARLRNHPSRAGSFSAHQSA